MTVGNEPVYPSNWVWENPGLSKREYFAGQIMAALIAERDASPDADYHWANRAVEMANALCETLWQEKDVDADQGFAVKEPTEDGTK